jgi:peptide/nickel transport system substrate-binding protein
MLKRICQMIIPIIAVVLVAGNTTAAELIIGARTEPSIDPHFLYLETNIAYAKHIFGRLVGRDNNSRREPDLATSWKALDDTTWEFKLRKGVKFHDGSEFTAEDVVFTIKRIPNVPNNPASYVGMIRSIVDLKIVDPYTLIIKTGKPYPALPTQLHNVSIVSKKLVEGATTADFNSGKVAIGTGPYKFVKYIPGDRLVLERNENYWGQKPAYDKVTFKIITNDAARVAALLGGDIDMMDYVPPSDIAHLEKNKNFVVFQRPADRVIFLHMDSSSDQARYATGKDGRPLAKNPLKDLRVRKAISKAINRDAICRQVMDGLATPSSQMIPEGWFGYSPNLKVEKYDPEGAKKLLAEAGYPNGFGLTIHGPNDRYVNDAKVCQAIGQMLARIGLDMKVDTMPKSIYFGRFTPPTKEFSLALLGWGTSETCESIHGLMGVTHSYDKAKGTGVYNLGYFNPVFDKAAEEAVIIIDDAKREKALQKAMEILIADQAIIPLHVESTVVATRKGITYTVRPDQACLAYNAKPSP